jgi:signal transduction histidine kinase
VRLRRPETRCGVIWAYPLGGTSCPPAERFERGGGGGTLGHTVATHSAAHSQPAQKRHEVLVDAGIAVAVFAATLGLLVAGDGGGRGDASLDAPAVLLAAAASLPLIARRRYPLAVFVLTALAATALQAIATPDGPPIGPTVALYTLAFADDESRGRRGLTLAIVGGLLVVHATASGIANDRFPGAELLFGVVLWSATWLAGDRARLRAERMAELEDRALRAEREAERERRLAATEERMRIARDLHDSAGHAINVILVHAGAGRLQAERDPAAAREAFQTIEEVARETVGEIDQIVGALRDDSSPATDGDHVEPPAGFAAVEGLVERHRAAGLEVTISYRGEQRVLTPGVDRAAYRILQEALTNAARHGDGSARVELGFEPDALDLVVANRLPRNGHAPASDGRGHGVVGMRERAALVGGALETGARDGWFRMHARLPIDGDQP